MHSHSRRAAAHAFYEALVNEESPKYFIKKIRRPAVFTKA